MKNQDLIFYIKEQLKAGVPRDVITERLMMEEGMIQRYPMDTHK